MAASLISTSPTRIASGMQMSLEHYLNTTFRPDREYVDGVAEQRCGGEFEHGRVLYWLGVILSRYEQELGVQVVVECRLQVKADRFRIPDLMILRAGDKIDRYPRRAPLVCLEILSPEDTWQRLRKVVEDYLEMGVGTIWALDPETQAAYLCDAEGFHKTARLSLPGSAVLIEVDEIFSILR